MGETINELAEELKRTTDPRKSLQLARRIRSLVDAREAEKNAQRALKERSAEAERSAERVRNSIDMKRDAAWGNPGAAFAFARTADAARESALEPGDYLRDPIEGGVQIFDRGGVREAHMMGRAEVVAADNRDARRVEDQVGE